MRTGDTVTGPSFGLKTDGGTVALMVELLSYNSLLSENLLSYKSLLPENLLTYNSLLSEKCADGCV